MSAGRLVVVATPIGNLGDLSPRAATTLADADIVCCEDTRHTGRLLAHAGVTARRLVALHGHNEAAKVKGIVQEIEKGAMVALVSDAGTPLVSDPGERLVAAAAAAGIEVAIVPGPSAGVAALVVSGLSTGRWRFEGFLAKKGAERRERLAEIADSPVPTICYEAPHRLRATLADLVETCGPARIVVVARELTKLHEEVWRGSLGACVTWATEHEPRGEIVLIVDAVPPRPAPSAEAVDQSVEALLRAGLARRDVVTAIEVVMGVAHRTAYDAVLRAVATSEASTAPA